MTTQVLLATYNGEEFLEQQLDSILSQTHVDIVVADDGSTDKTLEILRHYSSSERVTIAFSEPVGGPVANFGRLLDLTDSEFFALSDQDDIWLPHRIETQRRLLQDGGSAAFSDLILVDSENAAFAKSFFELNRIDPNKTKLRQVLAQNPMSGNATLYRHEVAVRATPIPQDVFVHDWWIALVAAAIGECKFTDESLVRYRQHGTNVVGGMGRIARLGLMGSVRAAIANDNNFLANRDRFAHHLLARKLVVAGDCESIQTFCDAAQGNPWAALKEAVSPSPKFHSVRYSLGYRAAALCSGLGVGAQG